MTAGTSHAAPRRAGHARAYLDLARPFTLVAPALGFLSGALTAIGAFPREPLLPALSSAAIAAPISGAVNSAGDHGSRGAAPIAVSAPETKPSAGATRVNGRAKST